MTKTHTWDVHAIIRKAGLDDLLLGRDKKSVHIIVRDTFINRSHSIPFNMYIQYRLVLHDVLSNHSRSIKYPEDFLTANHMVLMYVLNVSQVFPDLMFSDFCTTRCP